MTSLLRVTLRPAAMAWALREREAVCQTQHMTAGYALETWIVSGVVVVVLVYANKNGWEIFTACGERSVSDTLADADARVKAAR